MPQAALRRIKKSYLARFAAWALVHNFVDLLAMALPIRRKHYGRKRVVFVKLDGVGDYIIWTAAFEAIRGKYPSLEFERILIANERFREFADIDGTFDERVFINVAKLASSPSYRFGVMRKVGGLGASVIVNPRLTRDFLWGDSVVRCSGAETRIGSEGIENLMSPFQERLSAKWYTELKASPEPGIHELFSNASFLEVDLQGSIQPRTARTIFDREVLPDRYLVVFVGAFSADKRWPLQRFATAAKAIADEHDLGVVLCGGPGEEHLADEFGRHFKGVFLSLIGQTTLLELAGVIENAKLTISNDTAAGHIAVAQRCPSVIVTPGNHVGRFFPYPDEAASKQVSVIREMPCFGCGWQCIYTDLAVGEAKPCIAGVEVAEVVNAAKQLLSAQG
ncbi:MAG: glycosyltransferase family 9 protein [Pyrinomonadaceae bacterium]|nr:glycosyltransferase family 9 protein [Pyrinomonadaceae bacterium]MBP9108170.1 glycosyltransferase family 9 protein [Pyrinomonadaceae bacterium]